MSIDLARITSIVESLIFVSEKPLSFRKIRAILDGVPAKDLQTVVEELVARCRAENRGMILEEVAEGWQFRTPPENQEWIKMLVEYKPMRLSRASLETLAIIAYRQPTAKTDVETVRGVDSTSAVAKLLELGLLKILGRKEIPGRPFVYGTTPEFLEVFNLASLNDLPSLKEIEDLDPGEIEAFTEKLADAAGANVEPTAEGEPPAPELDALEQAAEPDAPNPESRIPNPETDPSDEPEPPNPKSRTPNPESEPSDEPETPNPESRIPNPDESDA